MIMPKYQPIKEGLPSPFQNHELASHNAKTFAYTAHSLYLYTAIIVFAIITLLGERIKSFNCISQYMYPYVL